MFIIEVIKGGTDIIYPAISSLIVFFWENQISMWGQCQSCRFGPCEWDQSSAVGVNWASCPVSQANAGSGSYTNISTSAACFHGISIPNVFEDRRECYYFRLITLSHRKLWLNKWILTRGICIQKHSGFGGSGWCASQGLRRSVSISSFTALLLVDSCFCKSCLTWSSSQNWKLLRHVPMWMSTCTWFTGQTKKI